MISKHVRAGLALPLLIVSLVFLAAPGLAQEGGPHRAGLALVHGDGRVVTRCVTFSEESISGLTLLQRSGLALEMASGGLGSAICTLDGEGCPASDCFCRCKGGPCAYWNYFHRNADGSWTYSGVGASMWTLHDGDVDGWVWGDGATAPAALAFEDVCATGAPAAVAPTGVPTATPAPAPPPTATPTGVPTATPAPVPPPTTTPTSTATAVPSLTPAPAAVATETLAPKTPSQIFIPAVGGRGGQESPQSRFTLIPPALQPLWRQYGSLVLLLLALAVLVWIKRKRGQ